MPASPDQPLAEWTLFSPTEIQKILDSPTISIAAWFGANPYRKPQQKLAWHYLVCGEIDGIRFLKTGLYTGCNPLDRNKKLYKRVVKAFQVPSNLARLHDTITVILLSLYSDTESFYSRHKTTFDGYTESFFGEEDDVARVFCIANRRVMAWSSQHQELQATAELNLLQLIIWHQSIAKQADLKKKKRNTKDLREHLYDSIYFYKTLPLDWIDYLMEIYGMPRPAPPAFYLAKVENRLKILPCQEDLAFLQKFKEEIFEYSNLTQGSQRGECYKEIHRLLKRKRQYTTRMPLVLEHIETFADILEAFHGQDCS
jgi:hypothetical protein